MQSHAADSETDRLYALRCGLEGVTFDALLANKPIVIRRMFRIGRCEQFAIKSLGCRRFLAVSSVDSYRNGRALSYLFAYLDFLEVPAEVASDFAARAMNVAGGSNGSFVDALVEAFAKWMLSRGFERDDAGGIPFSDGYRMYVESGFDKALDAMDPINSHPQHQLERIDRDINDLLELLNGANTNQLLWIVLLPLISGSDNANEVYNLTTAYKSLFYLLGLIMQSQPGRRILTNTQILEVYTTLERIASFYRDLPSWRDREDAQVTAVVARAFVHKSHNALLISAEQQRGRIVELFTRYPEEMRAEFGLIAEDIDQVLSALIAVGQRKAQDVWQSSDQTAFHMKPTLAWSLRQFVARLKGDRDQTASNDYARMIEPFCFAGSDLDVEPSMVAAFLEHLSSPRNLPLKYKYFAGDTRNDNPAERRPLVRMDDGRYFLPMANVLCHAIYLRGMHAISKNTQQRDMYLEEKSASVLRKAFPNAILHRSLQYQNEDGELDLVVISERSLIVAESKAGNSPLAFRDPDVAITRLKRALDDRDSPFYGVSQGQRLLKKLKAGDAVQMVDTAGTTIVLDPTHFDEYFIICVTLDDWAPFVIDWNLLEMIESDVGRPWAIDIDKLETLVTVLRLRGWDGSDLLVYLRERYPLHGKMVTLDELDYAANFIFDGSLESLSCTRHTYYFEGRGPSALFDDIEEARMRGKVVAVPVCRRPSLRGSNANVAAEEN